MKKSPKPTRIMMNGGLFSNSSDENNSDDDKCRLPTVDSIVSANDKEKQLIVKRRQAIQNSTNNENDGIRRNQTVNNINRLSSNESERTDSEIGYDTELCRQHKGIFTYHLIELLKNKTLNNKKCIFLSFKISGRSMQYIS
jgi:hypothetical protein